MPPKRILKPVHGVLLLDKPEGLTSNDALQKARRLFSAARAGHTGTLDPMATGLLPLCFGEATKFSADLLEADKTYEATLCLGRTTETGDREGRVIATAPVRCDRAAITAALPGFLGTIAQVPPMYSALKHNGRPLYQLARQGQEVERPPRPVTIHALQFLDWQAPELTLRIRCGKGTYIRVLAEDIGKALGCGAHLTRLRRTEVGNLGLAEAHTLSELEALDEACRLALLAAVDCLISTLPVVCLDEAGARRFCHGNPVPSPSALRKGKARVYARTDAQPRLLGVGIVKADQQLWPERLVALD
ncbi:MAG: tRNA pseudouridine(55) synthase TruB [Zoogloeaceae bacterium]|nr:tRNA pseudouridine(55) synthase TruB [Zoogloeaceae bacterium]